MRNPRVREYITLTRFVIFHSLPHSTHLADSYPTSSSNSLQVLTPLSLLINIASVVICATVIKPNLREVSREYVPTSITPKTAMIATYLFIIYGAQIGYCVLLVAVRKPETKVNFSLLGWYDCTDLWKMAGYVD
jgi:hypothetical protein